jgi:hypothetical protein
MVSERKICPHDFEMNLTWPHITRSIQIKQNQTESCHTEQMVSKKEQFKALNMRWWGKGWLNLQFTCIQNGLQIPLSEYCNCCCYVLVFEVIVVEVLSELFDRLRIIVMSEWKVMFQFTMISWVTGCRPDNWIPFPPGTAVFFLPHNPLHLLSLGRQLDICVQRE